MENLLKYFKSKQDVEMFEKILLNRLKEDKSISEGPMLDGFVISLILTSSFVKELFLQQDMGRVLDGTIQKLEIIVKWCETNEKTLCEILENERKKALID